MIESFAYFDYIQSYFTGMLAAENKWIRITSYHAGFTSPRMSHMQMKWDFGISNNQ